MKEVAGGVLQPPSPDIGTLINSVLITILILGSRRGGFVEPNRIVTFNRIGGSLEGLGSSGHRSSSVRVVLVGFGSVGRALARLIAYKWDFIRSGWGVDVRVVGVIDSKGMALKADSFTVEELLKLVSLPRSSVSSFKP